MGNMRIEFYQSKKLVANLIMQHKSSQQCPASTQSVHTLRLIRFGIDLLELLASFINSYLSFSLSES
jgi:hypothetical protein